MTVLNQLFKCSFNDEQIKLFNKLNKALSQTSYSRENNLFELKKEGTATRQELQISLSSQIKRVIKTIEISKQHHVLLLEVDTDGQDKEICLPEESYSHIKESLNNFIKKVERYGVKEGIEQESIKKEESIQDIILKTEQTEITENKIDNTGSIIKKRKMSLFLLTCVSTDFHKVNY